MFCLTYRERKVLIFIGILIFIGSLLKFFNVNLDGKTLSSPEYSEYSNKPIDNPISSIVNINTASREKLTDIIGIGDVIAERIIEYRLKNGLFQNLNDIKKIKGIGNKKFDIIKNKITL
ncbi:MAG: helix-hairpin-helix domain-containing protein [Candidatus Omnitrophica bacterium]|nr:helix-hairpin-helix domain-containing protein [Candidatus Omnitrophota bacterium]MCK5492923.1 helix-hairpin-helix domain-containing protein [Candidatus Omnitrophota bacterium]